MSILKAVSVGTVSLSADELRRIAFFLKDDAVIVRLTADETTISDSGGMVLIVKTNKGEAR